MPTIPSHRWACAECGEVQGSRAPAYLPLPAHLTCGLCWRYLPRPEYDFHVVPDA